MIVRKFLAPSTREALRLVRDALGPDAIILSNRTTDGQVELMAVAESELQQGATPVVSATPNPVEPAARVFRNARQAQQQKSANITSPDLLAEVRSLRKLVEEQLGGFAWGESARISPARAEAYRQWLAAGFGAALGRQWLREMPADADAASLCNTLRQRLHRALQACAVAEDLASSTGIYALVGPTGVGKTTTIAKLGARCVLQHGPSQLAFVTTDSYRVGAEDQLRVYGKLLGVPVMAARDGADFDVTLDDLGRRRLILVDTIGMGQRDRRMQDQLALLGGSGRPVQRILVLAANAQASTLEDVVQRYSEGGLAGCILSKIDEAVRLGEVLDVIVRHRLPLHFVANGQRVPEDLHRPNPLYLADRAFRAVSGLAPLEVTDEELALYAAALERRGAVPSEP